MNFKFIHLYIVAFWIALGGACAVFLLTVPEKTATSTEASPAFERRKMEVANAVRSGPKTEAWKTPHGEVIKLDVPYASAGGRRVENKHCVVWRDAITNSSSIHCEKNQLDTRDYPSDPADHGD